jgi:hypothetical protein
MFLECADELQSIADCTDDTLPLQDIRSHLKTKNLFRFAALQTSGSSASTKGDDEPTDLRLDVSTSNGRTRIAACYDPYLFDSVRVMTILSQLFHIVESAAKNRSQAIGSIDMLTSKQRELLPDPTNDLVGATFVAQYMTYSPGTPKCTPADLVW